MNPDTPLLAAPRLGTRHVITIDYRLWPQTRVAILARSHPAWSHLAR